MAKPKRPWIITVYDDQVRTVIQLTILKAQEYIEDIKRIEGINLVIDLYTQNLLMIYVSPLYDVKEVVKEIEDLLSSFYIPDAFKEAFPEEENNV